MRDCCEFLFSHIAAVVKAWLLASPLFWVYVRWPQFHCEVVVVALPLVLRLWIAAITHFEFGLLIYPGFGLLLSCFGHARAKNNSELPCGLSSVHLLVGIAPWLSLPSSQGCEGIVLLRYAVVGLRTVVSGIRGWVCMRSWC